MIFIDMAVVKFATQVDAQVLADVRRLAKESDRSIARIVTDALAEHVRRARVRPAFRSAMDEVLTDHADLLTRLAK